MGARLMGALNQALIQMDQVSKMFADDEEFQRARQEAREALDAAREDRGVPYDKLVEGSPEALMALVNEGFADLARAEYGQQGSVEIDVEAHISKADAEDGADSGAYVNAWVWVDAYEAARLAYRERCIELYKGGDRTLVNAYRDPHPHEVTESDEDYLRRIAEQDFNDGEHGGSVYPELREQLLKLAGYTSDDECAPGAAL
jgi:hypothetical protein